MAQNILSIKNLNVSFSVYGGNIKAVRNVSLSIEKGEILALVGESGCGKSTVAQSILGLNSGATMDMDVEVLSLGDFDLRDAKDKELEKVRGTVASMIFQDPLTSLNPTMKVGKQITEILHCKQGMTREQCKAQAIKLLELVQIPEATRRAEQFPHQFSGGMQQRAMIAMAISCNPMLLIADEPTTALDVTIQLEILRLLKKIRSEIDTAILLITHDFSVVANLADRIAVMYGGQIVEEGNAQKILTQPAHPYTRGLLESLPKPKTTGMLKSIPGSPPDLFLPPPGCGFAQRCPNCMHICQREEPPKWQIAENHTVSCWKFDERAKAEGNK